MLDSEVRWLAQQFGTVRSLDVLIAASRNVGIRTRLAKLRHQAFVEMVEVLRTPRVRTLLLDLVQWLALGAWLHDPRKAPRLDKFAAAQLDRRLRRLMRKGEGFPELDDRHRHRVRIEAKKLRYATEFLASIYGGEKAAKRRKMWLDTLETLLEALGDLNDEAVAAETLASFGIDRNAVTFDHEAQEALRRAAELGFATLSDLKRYWR